MQHTLKQLILIFLCFLLGKTALAQTGIIELKKGHIMLTKADRPPSQKARGWQAVSLPDQWTAERYAFGRNAWYRFELEKKTLPIQRMAIYLPKLNMNAAVYFNGEWIGDGGRFSEPVARNWSRPLFFTVPHILWETGLNTIDIRLKSYQPFGLLMPPKIAPANQLRPEYTQRYFYAIEMTTGIFLLTLTMAGLMFALWCLRRQKMTYLYFSLTALFWSFYSLNGVVQEIPVSFKTWEWMVSSSIAFWVVALTLFCRRFVEKPNGLGDTILLVYAGLAGLAYALSSIDTLALVSMYVQIFGLGLGVYAVVILWQYQRKLRQSQRQEISQRQALVFAIGLALVLLASVHDWLLQAGIIFTKHEGYHLLQLTTPMILLYMIASLIKQFIQALNEAEHLNNTLEQGIEDAKKALKISYQKIQKLKTERAVGTERSRIFTDLHDDLGARLLSLVYRSESPEQQGLAREAMNELREIVRVNNGESQNLAELTQHWKHECEQRCQELGIPLQWNAWKLSNTLILPARTTMHATRLLREALSNALKNQGIRQIRVRIQHRQSSLFVSVSNDGSAFNPAEKTGSGMNNMQGRVHKLQGRIRWRANRIGGCHVIWQLPINEAMDN